MTTSREDVPPHVNLLVPLRIRGVTIRNRIAVSPMCQYCAIDGMADDWHLVHLGSRAVGGAGLVIMEATAVTPEGRISPGDLGIWEDRHIEPLARIARFIERMGSTPAIQLAHAGRKGSVERPWEGGRQLAPSEADGWQTIAPSAIAFSKDRQPPRAMETEDIMGLVHAFAVAARRALEAGFKVIELHFGHGYLVHQFLSPLSNQRRDEYGGSLENRMRLALSVAAQVRERLGEEIPLFVRLSATDWVEGGWDLTQTIPLAKALRECGVDLIDTSGAGVVPNAKIPVSPGYLVPFAAAIRHEAHICTGAVGLITEPAQADTIIRSGSADMVLLAREMLREPYWALKAMQVLGAEPAWPLPYGYAVRRKS